MRLTIAALLVVALSVPAGAQRTPPVPGPLATAKSLRCSFPIFAAARWGDTPEVVPGTQEFSFQIDSFDFRRSRARIVGTATVPASLIASETGLHVIEQTPGGNVTVTSVFAGGATGTSLLSVHSRHLGEPDGPPRLSQAYGKCEIQ